MTEYLYNCIRASAGEDVVITAELTNDENEYIEEGAYLTLFDNSVAIGTYEGNYIEYGVWTFTIPAQQNIGRYWYAIGYNNISLCFKQPIYFM